MIHALMQTTKQLIMFTSADQSHWINAQQYHQGSVVNLVQDS